MMSATTSAVQYEIWLYARPGFRSPVQACGLFDSGRECRRVGSRLRDWLRLGVWASEFDALPYDSIEELYLLRLTLSRGLGIDLAKILVTARPCPAPGGDNAPAGVPGEHWRLDAPRASGPVADDSDDDDDADDTTLAPPDHRYEVVDGSIDVPDGSY